MTTPTILVFGDPMLPADRIAARFAEALSPEYTIGTHQWGLSYDEAVAANRAIERGGPDAVAVDPDLQVDPASVVGVVTHFFPLGEALLARFRSLRFVATVRAGAENIDDEYLSRSGIELINNAGRNANAVAEMTIALILSRLRGVGEGHHRLRSGEWRPADYAEGYHELAGSPIGLIGLDAIGRLVLHRLSGFDLDACYYDPYAEQVEVHGARPAGLDELLERSRIVSLHARHVPGNPPILGADELDRMREDAILVNTARSGLIDEEALLERLRSGRIAGASLDVFGVEPLPEDHPLRILPTVALSPHLGGVTVEARTRAPGLLADRVVQFLGLGPGPTGQ